jgi:arsenate reductase
MDRLKVLFLCTGNSCRSQMAEAIVNARLDTRWQAYSAGSHPASEVHPLALRVLAEIGIDHHGRPKSIQDFSGQAFEMVITLCDDSDEDCPVWLGPGKKIHRPFPDPAKASGTQAEVLQAFRRVRDEIGSAVTELLSN